MRGHAPVGDRPVWRSCLGSLQMEAPLIHADRKLVQEMMHHEAEQAGSDPLNGSLELLRLKTNTTSAKANSSSKPDSSAKYHSSQRSTRPNDLSTRTEPPK